MILFPAISCLKRRIQIFPPLLCLAASFFCAAPLKAQPNFYETQEIKKQIIKNFNELIDIWNEELYFEMYQFGTSRSQKRLKKIEFVQRLVDLHWKPSLNPIEDIDIKLLYRNFATIEFIQEFVNKFDQTRKVKKRMIFPTIKEGATWKIDLTQLINIPYEGEIADKKPEKKEIMDSTSDSTSDSTLDSTSDATADAGPQAQ